MARLPNPATGQRWSRLIRLHEQSDLSVADFCDIHDVSTGSLYQWKKKLREQADQNGEFLAVQVDQPRPQSGTTKISFPCGTQIELDSCDTGSLMSIVNRLAPQADGAHR